MLKRFNELKGNQDLSYFVNHINSGFYGVYNKEGNRLTSGQCHDVLAGKLAVIGSESQVLLLFSKNDNIKTILNETTDFVKKYLNLAGMEYSYSPIKAIISETSIESYDVGMVLLQYSEVLPDKTDRGLYYFWHKVFRYFTRNEDAKTENILNDVFYDLSEKDFVKFLHLYSVPYNDRLEVFTRFGDGFSEHRNFFYRGFLSSISTFKSIFSGYNPKITPIVDMIKPKKERYYKLKVFSRHPTHAPLRKFESTKRVVIRFGSQTRFDDDRYIQINSPKAVANSSSKFLMKELFAQHSVKTAVYCIPTNEEDVTNWANTNNIDGRVIVKSEHGSRGIGLYIFNNVAEAITWFNRGNRWGNYLVERYHPYSKEYRLHVTKNGCFYSCRKMLRNDTPTDKKWFRNDSNSNWILEENSLFERPKNWKAIEADCVKALEAVGLDVGACDVRVQSNDKKEPDFIICEINSAPSFGARTLEKYAQEIPKIIKSKV